MKPAPGCAEKGARRSGCTAEFPRETEGNPMVEVGGGSGAKCMGVALRNIVREPRRADSLSLAICHRRVYHGRPFLSAPANSAEPASPPRSTSAKICITNMRRPECMYVNMTALSFSLPLPTNWFLRRLSRSFFVIGATAAIYSENRADNRLLEGQLGASADRGC